MKATLFFLFISTSVMADSVCGHLRDDCEYYTCLSQIKHCSASSYPQNFGRKYCLRYAERRTSFSEAGKIWIEDVKRCLIREMEGFESELSCSALRKRAFKSHIPCYVSNGFCSLEIKDKKEILKTIWPAIGNVYTITNGINIVKECN